MNQSNKPTPWTAGVAYRESIFRRTVGLRLQCHSVYVTHSSNVTAHVPREIQGKTGFCI